MDDLVVNDELTTSIVDDKSSDAATTIIEGTEDLVVKTTLVDDGEAVLDITTLSHADKTTVLTGVKDSVLLEDWASHALDHNGWLWVAGERALLVELSGEQVNTEVSVLASLT